MKKRLIAFNYVINNKTPQKSVPDKIVKKNQWRGRSLVFYFLPLSPNPQGMVWRKANLNDTFFFTKDATWLHSSNFLCPGIFRFKRNAFNPSGWVTGETKNRFSSFEWKKQGALRYMSSWMPEVRVEYSDQLQLRSCVAARVHRKSAVMIVSLHGTKKINAQECILSVFVQAIWNRTRY